MMNEPWNHSTWTAIGADPPADPAEDPTEHFAGEDAMAIDAGNQPQPDQQLQHDEPTGDAAEQLAGEDAIMTDEADNQHQPDQQLPHDVTKWRKVWFQRADGSWFYEYRRRKLAGAQREEDGQHAVQ